MLHVILLILKIIGWILLGILGLLLGILLLVLLVPVRYRVEGSYYGSPRGTARITWLLHILSLMVSYEEELQITVKVFGFPLFQGDADEEADEEDFQVTAAEILPEPLKDPILEEKATETPRPETEENIEEGPETKPISTPVSKQRRTHFLKRISEKIKYAFRSLCGKLRVISGKWDKVKAFLQNEENKKTFHLILWQLKKMFKHILPRKATGKVTFGFDDPYTTGQVLSAAAIFYGWYGKHVEITPVFDRSLIEGEGKLKGRIRFGTLLFLGLRILMNKNFRMLLKKLRSQGGILDG